MAKQPKSQKGQSLIEYALIIVLIVGVAVVIYTTLSNKPKSGGFLAPSTAYAAEIPITEITPAIATPGEIYAGRITSIYGQQHPFATNEFVVFHANEIRATFNFTQQAILHTIRPTDTDPNERLQKAHRHACNSYRLCQRVDAWLIQRGNRVELEVEYGDFLSPTPRFETVIEISGAEQP